MKYRELKKGQMFNIEDTPSYPKLKLGGNGYVDMRDEIINESGSTVMDRDVYIMTIEDISKKFKESVAEIAKWVEEIKLKYIK